MTDVNPTLFSEAPAVCRLGVGWNEAAPRSAIGSSAARDSNDSILLPPPTAHEDALLKIEPNGDEHGSIFL